MISGMTKPKFSRNQVVCFVGGSGKIKNYQSHAGEWFYAIQMDMGPEPEMGRVGYETTILLDEIDIATVVY